MTPRYPSWPSSQQNTPSTPYTGKPKDETQHHELSNGGAFGYVPIPGKPHIFVQTQQDTPSTPGQETQNLDPDEQIQVRQWNRVDQTRMIQEKSTQHKGLRKPPRIAKTASDVSSSMVPDPTRHGTRNIIRKEICIIEDLLKEAGTLQDSAKKQRYTQKITKILSETKSKLMARFWDSPSDDGDATEHDTLWTSLDNATFNNTRLLIQCLELDQDRGTGSETTESNTKETEAYKESGNETGSLGTDLNGHTPLKVDITDSDTTSPKNHTHRTSSPSKTTSKPERPPTTPQANEAALDVAKCPNSGHIQVVAL